MKTFKKYLVAIGLPAILLSMAFGMNACGKKKGSNNNPYGPYGYGNYNYGNYNYGNVGGSFLGNGGAIAPDGSTLELSFSGQDGGQVQVQGLLRISPQAYSMGCGIPPGDYMLQTQQPGYFQSGNFGQIGLIANNGMPVTIQSGWLYSSYVTMPSGQQVPRMFAITNIPGCPTNFGVF